MIVFKYYDISYSMVISILNLYLLILLISIIDVSSYKFFTQNEEHIYISHPKIFRSRAYYENLNFKNKIG